MEHLIVPDSKTRLLIVEMEDAFRRHIADRLRAGNFMVFEACHDTEANQILQSKSIEMATWTILVANITTLIAALVTPEGWIKNEPFRSDP
jgi:hypothetical protein